MSIRGNVPESFSSVESGIRETGNVVVGLAEMQQIQQSDLSQNNTAFKQLKPLEIVDELAKKPVCEDAVCIGDTRHVDVYSTANFAQDQFKLLDRDGNKFITDREVTAYQERFKENMTPRMQGHLEELKKNYSHIMRLSNDEPGFERSGMTMKDLDAAESIENGVRTAEHIKEFVTAEFTAVDADRNGFITAREVRTFERTSGNSLAHPVSDREAMKVLGHLAEGRNFANATSDYLGMFDFYNSGRGLTRDQALKAADLVKEAPEKYIDRFSFSAREE